MNDFLLNLMDDHKRTEEDLRYLSDFIQFKGLDDEFQHLKEHAPEYTGSELPFPYLVL